MSLISYKQSFDLKSDTPNHKVDMFITMTFEEVGNPSNKVEYTVPVSSEFKGDGGTDKIEVIISPQIINQINDKIPEGKTVKVTHTVTRDCDCPPQCCPSVEDKTTDETFFIPDSLPPTTTYPQIEVDNPDNPVYDVTPPGEDPCKDC